MKTFKLTYDNVWDVAEGIDFMPIFSNKIIASYTKEQFQNLDAFPKTNYQHWIIRNGKKVYLQINTDTYIDKNKDVWQKLS